MRQFLLATTILFAFQANADAFKCKDEKGKITYQELPCSTSTVGKVGRVQDAPIEDQIRTRARVNNMILMDRQKQAAEEAERQKWQSNARRQEAAEQERRRTDLLERQIIAAEKAAAAEEKAARRAAAPPPPAHSTPPPPAYSPQTGKWCQQFGGVVNCW